MIEGVTFAMQNFAIRETMKQISEGMFNLLADLVSVLSEYQAVISAILGVNESISIPDFNDRLLKKCGYNEWLNSSDDIIGSIDMRKLQTRINDFKKYGQPKTTSVFQDRIYHLSKLSLHVHNLQIKISTLAKNFVINVCRTVPLLYNAIIQNDGIDVNLSDVTSHDEGIVQELTKQFVICALYWGHIYKSDSALQNLQIFDPNVVKSVAVETGRNQSQACRFA